MSPALGNYDFSQNAVNSLIDFVSSRSNVIKNTAKPVQRQTSDDSPRKPLLNGDLRLESASIMQCNNVINHRIRYQLYTYMAENLSDTGTLACWSPRRFREFRSSFVIRIYSRSIGIVFSKLLTWCCHYKVVQPCRKKRVRSSSIV